MPKMTEKQKTQFWSKINIKGINECWEFMGSLNNGYGLIKIQYKNYRAHRIAYFLHYKKDPGDLLVCHSCDNPTCCNPNHLWLGTLSDDMQDMIKKGRGNKARGSKHYRAKLTEAQVKQIRKQHTNGKTQFTLAQKYGVDRTTICDITRRKNWAHI